MGNDDDWKFDLDDKDKKQVQSQTKDGKHEALFKKDHKRLKVDTENIKRKESRAKIARRQAALENQKEVFPANMGKRLVAHIIDLAIVGVATGLMGIFLKGKLLTFYSDKMRELNMDQPYSPAELEQAVYLLFGVISFLVFQIFYSMIKKRSIGKSVTNLYVLSSNKEENASAGKMLIRELILKPISLILVVGYIFPFINEDRRSIHDFFCGTFVSDE